MLFFFPTYREVILLGLFDWLKNKAPTTPIGCKSCRHYGFFKSDDKLNPDKTITKGVIRYEFCTKGEFYLNDYKACDYHEEGKRSARIMPPPISTIPPKINTSISKVKHSGK